MPGRALDPSTEAVPILHIGSLRGHKAFPRRKQVIIEPTPTRHAGKEHVRHRSDQITYSSAERIKSWIPDPSPIRVVPIIGVPLTPPINFRDDFQSWIDDAALRSRQFTQTKSSVDSDTTPLVQQSPPTPDTTPPRKVHRAQAVSSFSSFRNLTGSRTESFTTAREEFSSPSDSGDEHDHLESPSLHSARQKWLRATGLDKQKNVGLGLGLEIEDGEATPRETTPKRSPTPQHFPTLNGSWPSDMEDPKIQEVLTDPVKPAPFNTSHKRPRVASIPNVDSPTLGEEHSLGAKRQPRPSNRVERSRRSTSSPSARYLEKQPRQLVNDEEKDMENEIQEMNNKRLSQVSTASTTVSAVVVNTPPQRRQTLRRTSKMPDLNTPPSKKNPSTRDRLLTRQHLRRSGSPEQELRKSFASHSPDNAVASVAAPRQDLALTDPQRRASTQSSTSGSKRLSNTFSHTSRQQSSRPTTAPEESVGYFDIPRPRDRRTMSVVIHAPVPVKPTETKPVPAVDESQLLPVMKNTEEPSTENSVTSPRLDAFYAPATPNDQPMPVHHSIDASENRTPSIDRLGTGEWSVMRPRSTMVTPFSLRSAHSSTPGTLEVSEATAISIFPHTNKSILVIQQMASGSTSSPREQSAIITGEANIALPGPVVFHETLAGPTGEVVHSPLQNPRDPPQPPDLRIIAPTPATGPPSPDKASPIRRLSRKARFSAPVSSLKRTFSARRPRSESLTAPFTRTFSLRGTASTSHEQADVAEAPDVKLHPFWRPRKYDDESDSESEFGNTGDLNGNRGPVQPYQEAPPPRRTMSLTRRLSNSIRFPSATRRPRPSSVVVPSEYDQTCELQRKDVQDYGEVRYEGMPKPGHTGQLAALRALADKWEQRRDARAEDKREERRQRLRNKIGSVDTRTWDGKL